MKTNTSLRLSRYYILTNISIAKVRYMLGVAMLTFLFTTSSLMAIEQNYMIYLDDENVYVKGAINAGNDKHFNEAAEAFAYAMGLLPEGGEIGIQPGTYVLKSPVEISKNVTISGSGRSTKLVVAENNTSGIGVMFKKAKGAQLRSVSLSCEGKGNSVAGIVLDNAGNCRVSDVAVFGFGQYGIWVKNESFLCDISESSFGGNQIANVFFDKHRWGEWGDFVPNTVSNCMIFGGGIGIHGFQTTVLNIIGCSFYHNEGAAIKLTEHSYSVLVSGCRTFQTRGDAVFFDGSGEINISSNIFCWHTGHGIVIKNCGWGIVSGNEIIDNGSYNPNVKNRSRTLEEFKDSLNIHYGVLLSNARGMNITANAIFNWPQAGKMKVGVFEDENCYENNVSENIINYFSKEAITSLGKNTVIGNNIINADKAYEGNPKETVIQSFPIEKMDNFINLIK